MLIASFVPWRPALLVLAGSLLPALAWFGSARPRIDPVAQPPAQALALAGATLVSEDLTCIAAGLLVREGRVSPAVGLLGCLGGIYVGDLGLWLAGRLLGRRTLRGSWLARRLPAHRVERWRDWLDRRGRAALLAARFLPGTRLPLYVASGALGLGFARFACWTGVAALAWTPLVVLSVALVGDAVVGPFTFLLGPGWPALLAAALVLLVLLRAAVFACTPVGRSRLVARVSRLWRWEFWPSWLFYLPVVPWVGWLALRYRSLTAWTAANPGIPLGGVVGESKQAILTELAGDGVLPSFVIAPGDEADRLGRFRSEVERRGWDFPLALKPDAGQRGAGFRLPRDLVDVAKYLQRESSAVLVQAYHPGPFEAGVFYYRIPGEPAGRIFSITDKHFPHLTGDGRSTVEELIWRHPRYRMQARTFLARHGHEAGRVLGDGERFALALAGNHCQGTMFRDGWHLWTPELERRVDAIARRFPGFCFGRFDVRYSDVDAFRAGTDLAVVELNGVTSESTNLYDPSRSLWWAYRVLFRQWALLYRIGDANRRRGHEPAPLRALLHSVLAYYRGPRPDPLAD